MRLAGKSNTQQTLHSDDATFCAIDVHPPELYAASDPPNRPVCYTGVIIPQSEYFLEFEQWKSTSGPDQRLEFLERIVDLVDNEDSRSVLCFCIRTNVGNGRKIGQAVIDDLVTRQEAIEEFETRKGRRYRFDGKEFGEIHAISMAVYAGAIVAILGDVSREITKQSSLSSLKRPIIQFLLDTVSGDPSDTTSPRWNKDLILFIVENSQFLAIAQSFLEKSCFNRCGIDHASSNAIADGEPIEGTNQIPVMIAVDWFTKICSRYVELGGDYGGLDEDDKLIVKIIDALKKRKCIIMREMPTVGDSD